MNTVPLAFVWHIWTRHRLGISISGVCLLAMAVAFPPVLRSFDTTSVFVATMIPVALLFAYVANSLIFSEEVGSLTSGYPRRMLTLPVKNRSLTLWPTLIAVVSVAGLWLAIALLIYRRAGYRPPIILPALGLAVAMTWNQTACWLPFKSHVAKSYVILVGLYLFLGLPGWLFVGSYLSHTSALWLGIVELLGMLLLATQGLASDRRGDVWSLGMESLAAWWSPFLDRLSLRPRAFHSTAEAQYWYEVRCHRSVILGMFLVVELFLFGFLLYVPTIKTFAINLGACLLLGMPLVVCTQGASIGQMRPLGFGQHRAITFVVTRPILTGGLVEAKYRMVTHTAFQTWIMAVGFAGAIVLTKGQGPEVASRLQWFMQLYPGWKGVVILVLSFGLVLISSWKLMTDGLVPGLTGRRWLSDGSVLLNGLILLSLISAGLWMAEHTEYLHFVFPGLIWTLAALLLVKMTIAVVGFRAAVRRGLLRHGSVLGISLAWIAMALATLLLGHLIVPHSRLPVPRSVTLIAALPFLPLGRFALAPLALDWNRHR
jgi:hypothetical protein